MIALAAARASVPGRRRRRIIGHLRGWRWLVCGALCDVCGASLIRSDTDGVRDVYDARENGGFRYVPPPTPCGGNDPCHGPVPPEPTPPPIGTEHFEAHEEKPRPCAKGKVRVKKHGHVRCVKKPHKHHRGHHKRANANRGGAR